MKYSEFIKINNDDLYYYARYIDNIHIIDDRVSALCGKPLDETRTNYADEAISQDHKMCDKCLDELLQPKTTK